MGWVACSCAVIKVGGQKCSVVFVVALRDTEEKRSGMEAYTFDLEDPRWLRHLDEEGYCVLRAIASGADVAEAKALLWYVCEDSSRASRATAAASCRSTCVCIPRAAGKI